MDTPLPVYCPSCWRTVDDPECCRVRRARLEGIALILLLLSKGASL